MTNPGSFLIERYIGSTTLTSWPRAFSAAGNDSITSPNPPVRASGSISLAARRIVIKVFQSLHQSSAAGGNRLIGESLFEGRMDRSSDDPEDPVTAFESLERMGAFDGFTRQQWRKDGGGRLAQDERRSQRSRQL